MHSFRFHRVSTLGHPLRPCGALTVLFLAGGCAALTPAVTPSPPAVLAQPRRDPACVGECLTGKDPFDTGCAADARTMKRAHVVTEEGQVIGIVELRRSPACGTGWARILRSDEMHDSEVFGGITVDGGASWLTHRAKHAVSLWTDMRFIPANSCVAASAVFFDKTGRAVADEIWASDCRQHRASLAFR